MFVRNGNVKKTLLALVAIAGLMEPPAMRAYQFSGPRLGYVADGMTSTLRAINGIPGASTMGELVSLDLKFRRMLVSVRGDHALAVSDDLAEVLLITNLSTTPSVLALAGVDPGGDLLALSPKGSLAAAYNLSNSRIQIVSGLPSQPVVRFEVNVAPFGHLSAMAVSEEGLVLAAFSDGETGSLYLFASNAAPRFISAVGSVSSITFPVVGDRAISADRALNQVILFEQLSTTATPIQLAGSADGVSDPVGIVLSRDAKTAYIANRGSGTVTIVSLAGAETQNVSCDCQPTDMQALQSDSLFALTTGLDQPIVLFDGQSSDRHVLVFPPKLQQKTN